MNYTYPKTYKNKSIVEQLSILKNLFPEVRISKISQATEKTSEGLFVIPDFKLVAPTYNGAVLKVMGVLKSQRPTYDYRSANWTEKYLKQLPIKEQLWNSYKDETLVISAQCGRLTGKKCEFAVPVVEEKCKECQKIMNTGYGECLVHSSPTSSSEKKSYERDFSHAHCWIQGKNPACGQKIENHKQCCLCDTPSPVVTNEGGWEEKLKIVEKQKGINFKGFRFIPVVEVENLIHSSILPKEREKAYYEGFDAGGKTKGGTGRIMYMRGVQEERKQINEKWLSLNLRNDNPDREKELDKFGVYMQGISLSESDDHKGGE